MARTVQKVDSLVNEDGSMEDALSSVLEAAEENGVVQWTDVSDDLTSGQWGRLIEKGILVDADGEGFVVDDPDGVRDALEESEPSEDEESDSSWTSWDKLAGVGALAMFVGYFRPSIRNVVGHALNVAIGPLNQLVPFYVVIVVLAVLTGLWSSLLQDRLTNLNNMSGYQEKQQELREREKEAKERGDDEELDEIRQEQMEMMTQNFGMMKQQFRSMPWIMLFTIPVFLWIYWRISAGSFADPVIVAPLFGPIHSWNTGVIVSWPFWIFWYMICSMGLSQIVRKALNIQTSPT